MNGFIANTDHDWYRQLLQRQRDGLPLDDVNFWTPSETPRFKLLAPAEPVLFRVKSPHNAIGGVGFFEKLTVLPAWLAWDTFGAANGVGSLAELEARLAEIRARNQIATRGEVRIGCILLAQPVFFEESDWVRLPADWPMKTVTGKTYDLSAGEGARVWGDVQQRLRGPAPAAADRDRPRYGEPQLVAPRLGQGGFRIAVLDAYDRACAVTTEHSLPVLEAAHIRAYAEGGAHDVTNGLLLRTDIHRLFDRGYVTVTPDLRFRVSARLRDDYANGRTYYALQDHPVAIPSNPRYAPSAEALAWHGANQFLG